MQMNRNPKTKSSIQQKGVYRIVLEFLNVIDKKSNTLGKNLFFLENIVLIGSIYLSKLFLFLKIKNQLILHQIIKEKKQVIRIFCISSQKNLILMVTKKNKVCLYHAKKEKKKKFLFLIKFFKFYKILSFSTKKHFKEKITSINFDISEKVFALAFQNGVIEISNLNAEIKMSFKLKNPLFDLKFQNRNFAKGKLYGRNQFFFLTEIDLVSKEIKCFRNLKKIMFAENYVILSKENITKISCLCHYKEIVVFNEKNYPVENFFILSDTRGIYVKNSSFFLKYVFSEKKKTHCLMYSYLTFSKSKTKIKNLEIWIDSEKKTNFWLRIFYIDNKFEILKPLSEKHEIFVGCCLFFARFNPIYDIKFIGRNNFFAVTLESNSIIIKAKKNFLYKNSFTYGNSIFLSMETKGAILIGMNNIGQIFIWNIVTLNINCCFFAFLNVPGVFSIIKTQNSKAFLLAGGNNGKIRNWEIFFEKNSKLHIRLVKTIFSRKEKINSLTVSVNGKIIALVTSNKELIFCKFLKLFPYVILQNFSRCFWCLAFSPKNKILIAGSGCGKLFVFDVFDGKCFDQLEGHHFPILCCKFSKNGFFFFSSASDGKIKIWKTDTGICVNTINNHTNTVWNFDIFPDCSFLISGCIDGKIILMKDCGLELAKLKLKNFKSFLKLQKNLDKINYQATLLDILKKIISFYDTELLYDFFLYFFEDFGNQFDKILSNLIQKLDIFHLKFLFHAFTVWSFKHTHSNMAHYLLNLFFYHYPFFYYAEISLNTLNFLILTTKQKLKKIKKIKRQAVFSHV